MNSVAVLIPIYKSNFSNEEFISFKNCIKIFESRIIILITYQELNIDRYLIYLSDKKSKYFIQFFKKEYFLNINSYNKLLINKDFFHAFKRFKYVLIHQLDSFVFRDELDYWCNLNYSYIGSPWLVKTPNGLHFDGVGNGGFSLRNVQDHLRVLNSLSYLEPPKSLFLKYFNRKRGYKKIIFSIPGLLKRLTISNNTFFIFNDFSKNEDIFWSDKVGKNFKWFLIPSPEVALEFGFEMFPDYCFELNGKKLPFGCHAWERYDLEFWKPYIFNKNYK